MEEIKEQAETKEAKEEAETKEQKETKEEADKKNSNGRKDSKDAKPVKKKSKKGWIVALVVGIILVLVIGLVTVGVLVWRFAAKETGGTAQLADGNIIGTEETQPDDSEADGDSKEEDTDSNELNNNSSMNTGELTENATEYEGREGTGDYNYGEALQKALLFYELQRSGDLPEETRCNWRGDSGLADGADVGLDLTGGLYDAGDHVKFNLPMSYTASTLAWSLYENRESYEESGQLVYMEDTLRWINDYLIKCHPEENIFYYQVGNGSTDHSWWGPAEVMQMERPSYKVDTQNPGSTVSAEAAASLASCAVVFKDTDEEYSELCLEHAKQLYEFATETQSDAGYTAANGFYTSHSGFYDEFVWAAAWLYLATEDEAYLTDAKEYFILAESDYIWAHCWDDVSVGAATILAIETQDEIYIQHVENNLDFWTTGVNGQRVTYTPQGLAWLDSWGSLRYATTEAFVALVYSKSDVCPQDKKDTYFDFALSQINYALGDTGRSYLIGFGENYPQNPHHRTAQGSYSNNMNEPAEARHTLYGALVGGPDAGDNYQDVVSNYTNNEVACDYNAGLVGALASLYEDFGGQTLVNFGAVEDVVIDEVYVDACVNVSGNNHLEVKAYVTNVSAWPARTLDAVTLRYFMDLSEVYENGGTAADISLTTNYSQGGSAVGVLPWDEENHIYYVEIQFAGEPIYPGGQSSYKKEVQFRMTSASAWDNSNDFSYQDIAGTNGGSLVCATHMALYEEGELIFGSEPDGEGIAPIGNTGTETNGNANEEEQNTSQNNNQYSQQNSSQNAQQNNNQNNTVPQGGNTASAENGLTMTVANQSQSGSGSSLSFFVTIQNNGSEAVSLEDLKVEYYFTADGSSKLNFWCDYAALTGSSQTTMTDKVNGTFSAVSSSGNHADTVLSMVCNSKDAIRPGDSIVMQVRIAKDDWSNFDFGNDYSATGVQNLAMYCEGNLLIGSTP